MRLKTSSIIAVVLTVVVITSCSHQNNLYEKAQTQISEGMTYEEVCAIMGSEGTDIGRGVILYEWKLEKDSRLLVWFSHSTDDTNAITITEYKIE